jgi:hypothetical protein
MLVLFACEKKEPPQTSAERREAAAAQTAKQKAEAAKTTADQTLDQAKRDKELAEKKLDNAKDYAKEAGEKLGAPSEHAGPDTSWRDEWVAFASGRDQTVDKGDYTLERASDGSITAFRKTQRVAGVNDLKHDALQASVKAHLVDDPELASSKIDVDVASDNTVNLTGTVDSARQAGEAVRIALGVPGADKVVSHLTWK